MSTIARLDAAALQAALGQCCGSCTNYRHWTRALRYTEGVKLMAEEGGSSGAYWLIDAIASHQSPRIDRACDGFQLWTLKVTHREVEGVMRHEAVLECRADSGAPALVRQEIEYTDFQMDYIEFYVEGVAGDRCLLLPGEH